jgi:predicted nucleic acid-binding protein
VRNARRTGRERVSGDEAKLFIGDVRERLTIINLNDQEYFKALGDWSSVSIAGGAIYDAVLARCALKVKAQAIYTWNTRDFTRFGPDITGRVKAPQFEGPGR